MGGTGPCGPMTIIFGSVIKTEYKSLTIKFGVNRAFHVLKSQFIDLTYMGGTRPCGPMTIIGHSMCSRPQFTDLAYMGGTGPCGPMMIIFGSVI